MRERNEIEVGIKTQNQTACGSDPANTSTNERNVLAGSRPKFCRNIPTHNIYRHVHRNLRRQSASHVSLLRCFHSSFPFNFTSDQQRLFGDMLPNKQTIRILQINNKWAGGRATTKVSCANQVFVPVLTCITRGWPGGGGGPPMPAPTAGGPGGGGGPPMPPLRGC